MAEKKETKKTAPKAKKVEAKVEEKEGAVTIEQAQVEEEIVTAAKEEPVVEEPKTVEDAIEQVDVNLNIPDNTDKLVEKINEQIEPIVEVTEEVKELGKGQEGIEKIINENPDKAEEVLKEQLSKAEDLKKKVNEMINNPQKATKKFNVTSWWNGMGYDF